MKKKQYRISISAYFAGFVALSVLFYILMNLFAVRPIGWGDYQFTTAGIVLIAPVMVIQNILAEVWGKNTAIRVTIFAIVCQLFVVVLAQVAIAMPTNRPQDAEVWASVFGSQWRVAIASIVAFALGSAFNILVFAKIRQSMSGDRFRVAFVVAAFFSTAVAQVIDSTVFYVLAFAPVGIVSTFEMPWTDIWINIGVGTGLQLLLETFLVAFLAVHLAKRLKLRLNSANVLAISANASVINSE